MEKYLPDSYVRYASNSTPYDRYRTLHKRIPRTCARHADNTQFRSEGMRLLHSRSHVFYADNTVSRSAGRSNKRIHSHADWKEDKLLRNADRLPVRWNCPDYCLPNYCLPNYYLPGYSHPDFRMGMYAPREWNSIPYCNTYRLLWNIPGIHA